MAALAFVEASVSIAMQMECSEEAWLIRMTFIFSRANVENNLIDTPTTPNNPLPCTLSKLILFIEEIPLMSFPFVESDEINVPAAFGLNVFLIQIGMPCAIAGCMVEGKITLAPKCESS